MNNNLDELVMYEELVREWPVPSPANVRRDLLEADIDVSLHATVVAANRGHDVWWAGNRCRNPAR